MGHNSVVSGYPKSIGILRVDELSTGSSDFGTSHLVFNEYLFSGQVPPIDKVNEVEPLFQLYLFLM